MAEKLRAFLNVLATIESEDLIPRKGSCLEDIYKGVTGKNNPYVGDNKDFYMRTELACFGYAPSIVFDNKTIT